MEDTSSHQEWELSKENIQPLRSGRKAAKLATIAQPTDPKKLAEERQEYENALRMYDGPDPLDPWYRYVNCCLTQIFHIIIFIVDISLGLSKSIPRVAKRAGWTSCWRAVSRASKMWRRLTMTPGFALSGSSTLPWAPSRWRCSDSCSPTASAPRDPRCSRPGPGISSPLRRSRRPSRCSPR